MDYHCNCCGFDFFMEEGYNGELDAVVCPMCRQVIEYSNVPKQKQNIVIRATEITEAQLTNAIQCLIDNGMDEDDAYVVLQTLGYILLDEELFPDTW